MDIAQHSKRIHPLVAIAAATVTLFSLLGIAAITGLLPSSHSSSPDSSRDNQQINAMAEPGKASDPGWTESKPGNAQPQKSVVHQSKPATAAVASNEPAQSTQAVAAPAPVKQQPKNSAVGIGVGAVVGGVIGNQVGSGDGKALATILGAVGGGYVGNEIAKKNQSNP